jgi:hypothetical protein
MKSRLKSGNALGTEPQGKKTMGLKAPSILTFMLSVILTVVVMITMFFGAQIPLLNGNEFWALLVAQLLLIIGCMVRGL